MSKKRITHKEAVQYANKLKEFCKNKNCIRCPFRVKVTEFEDGCVIDYPTSWSIEMATEKALKKLSDRDKALDEYYGC